MTSIDSSSTRPYTVGPTKPSTTTNQSSSQRQRNQVQSQVSSIHHNSNSNNNNNNTLQPSSDDQHIKGPIQDQLVLKNYRREQSANATAGRGRPQAAEAWGDEPLDDRRCGSYERADKNEEYQIVGGSQNNSTTHNNQAAKENNRYQPVTNANNTSTQGAANSSIQVSTKSEQRSKFVSPSPDPPANKKESATASNLHSRRKGSSTQQATQFLNASYLRPSRDIQHGVLNQSTNLNLQNMKQQIQSISSHPHHHTVLSSMMGQTTSITSGSSHANGHGTSKASKGAPHTSATTNNGGANSSIIHSAKASAATRTSASAPRTSQSGSVHHHHSSTNNQRKQKSSSVDPGTTNNTSHHNNVSHSSAANHSRHHNNSLSQKSGNTTTTAKASSGAKQQTVVSHQNAQPQSSSQQQNLSNLMTNLSLITNPVNGHPQTQTLQHQATGSNSNTNASQQQQHQIATKNSYFDSFVNKHLASGKAAAQNPQQTGTRSSKNNSQHNNQQHIDNNATITSNQSVGHQQQQQPVKGNNNNFYATQTIHSNTNASNGVHVHHPSSTKNNSLNSKNAVTGQRGATARNSVAYHPSSQNHQDRIGSVQQTGDHLSHTMNSFHPTSAVSRTIEAESISAVRDSFRASLGANTTTSHHMHHGQHQGQHDTQHSILSSHQPTTQNNKKSNNQHVSNGTSHQNNAQNNLNGSLNMNSISGGRPSHASVAGAHSTRHDTVQQKGNTKSKRPQSSNVNKGSTNLRNQQQNHNGTSSDDRHHISSNNGNNKYAIPTQTFSELEQRKRGTSQKINSSVTIQASISNDKHGSHHSVQRQSLQPKLSSTHADRRHSAAQPISSQSNANRTNNNLYKSYEKPNKNEDRFAQNQQMKQQQLQQQHYQLNLDQQNSSITNNNHDNIDLSASYKQPRRIEDQGANVLMHNNFTNSQSNQQPVRTENSISVTQGNEPISGNFVKGSHVYTPDSQNRVRLSSTFNAKSYSTSMATSAGPVASTYQHNYNNNSSNMQQQQMYEQNASHFSQVGTPQGVVPAPGTGAGYKSTKNSTQTSGQQNNMNYMYQPVGGASHASHLLAQQVNALSTSSQNKNHQNVQYKFYQTASQTQPINFHDPSSLLFNPTQQTSAGQSSSTQANRQQHQAQRI